MLNGLKWCVGFGLLLWSMGCLNTSPIHEGYPCLDDSDCGGLFCDNFQCKLEPCVKPSRACYVGKTGCTKDGEQFNCTSPCRSGTQSCINGFWGSCEGQTLPNEEVCDGKDNNCDGTRDEGFDEDGDGVTICAADPDCDDKNKDVYPGAAELCNNKDDDCDGKVDEELKRSCQSACGNGNEVCVDGKWSSCDAPAPKTEECNGQDDDCNGVPDDGDLCQTGESCQAGVCVKVSPCSPACKDTETCVEGQCVPKDPCAGVSCSATQECVDGKCVDKPQEEKVTQVEAPANEPTETEQTTGNDAGNTTPDNGNTTPDNGNTTPDNGTTTPDNGTTTPDNGVAPSGGCGCQSQSNSPFSWLALLMLLGLFFQALRIRRTS